MGHQTINVHLLEALNPEYAEALVRGELWAVKHATRVDSINRGEPERMRREFDGKRRKWCGDACQDPEGKGCVVCTLPENPELAQFSRDYARGRKR